MIAKSKWARYRVPVILLALVAGVVVADHIHATSGTKIFKGIVGPKTTTVVPPMVPTKWEKYADGSDSRLAVLLTSPDSYWLGITHALKSFGIPFRVTNDYRQAFRHKVVLVYPAISGALMSEAALHNLTEYAEKGGTVIAVNVLGGGLEESFGFGEVLPSRAHYKIVFTHPAADADPLEKEIPLNDPKAADKQFGSYSYTKPLDPPLAVYEDGSAAITDHKIGIGRTIAFGFDIGDYIQTGYNNRQEHLARSYDNRYEPDIDVLMRLIESVYRANNPLAVTLRPVPDGKKLAVMMTHDIDYTRSLKNAVEYARYEKEVGIRTTHFIQTKYIRDYSDDIILSDYSPKWLNQIQATGMELASHSVSHSRVFKGFPLGTGTESYPEYHPYVVNPAVTNDGTILGELRVSRFLLEQLVPGLHVESFRPGHLSNPYALPQSLMADDYKYSSSVTANDSLTHLPFQLNYDRGTDEELPVFEFPVSVEDEESPLESRLGMETGLAEKIARHGGICVVLIHPDVTSPKIDFEKEFVRAIRDYSWFGAMEDYGAWWAARNEVQVDTEAKGDQIFVHMNTPVALDGLTIVGPDGMHPLPGQPIVRKTDGDFVVLGRLSGKTDVIFTR